MMLGQPCQSFLPVFCCPSFQDLVLRSKFAPDCIKKNAVYMVEATFKGVRACILSHKRVSASTDEIITALPTPWADPQQSASHMLSRSKLCTWTQGERDDVMTGVGMIHLRQYRFQLKMLGQYEAVEWCMKMTPQAFFKRISFSIMPDSSPQDEDINCSLSFGLWQATHDFMFQGPYHCPSFVYCDRVALGLLRTILNAIKLWIEKRKSAKNKTCKWFLMKILFAKNDILRSALPTMRMVQSLAKLNKHDLADSKRVKISPHELMCGVRCWLRSLELHAGYYRFVQGATSTAGAEYPDRNRNPLAEEFQNAQHPEEDRPEAPSSSDALKKAILQHCRGCADFLPASQISNKLRSKGPFRKLQNFSALVTEQAGVLTNHGLLQKKDRNKKGNHKDQYKGLTWQQVQADDNARAACETLRLNRDFFA